MKLPHLGAIGIRLIIEIICKAEEAQGDDLFEMKDSLNDKGVVTKDIADAIQSLRFLGNDAAHEFKVKDYDLREAWRVINSLISYIYGTKDSLESLLTPTRLKKLKQSRLQKLAKGAKKAAR